MNTNINPIVGNKYFIDINNQNSFKFEVVQSDNSNELLSNSNIMDALTPVFWNTSKYDKIELIKTLSSSSGKTILLNRTQPEGSCLSDESISKTTIPVTENISFRVSLYQIPFFSDEMRKRLDNPIDCNAGVEIATLLSLVWNKQQTKNFSEYLEKNLKLIDERLMGDWLSENKGRFSKF